MSFSLLWLEAPLQSWGHDSRFGRRSTLPFPTRSGLMGLLCCASGRGGEQREWLERMRPMTLEVIAYALDGQPPAPMLRDFHMAGSGYDLADPWQNLLVPKKSDGGKPVGTGTRLTYRFYLQDIAFAIILELPEGMEAGIEETLCRPVWPICLGRKCCVPTDIIWRGLYPGPDSASIAAGEIAAAKNRHEIFRVVEGKREEGESRILADVPICFGPYKEYGDREVSILMTGDN